MRSAAAFAFATMTYTRHHDDVISQVKEKKTSENILKCYLRDGERKENKKITQKNNSNSLHLYYDDAFVKEY